MEVPFSITATINHPPFISRAGFLKGQETLKEGLQIKDNMARIFITFIPYLIFTELQSFSSFLRIQEYFRKKFDWQLIATTVNQSFLSICQSSLLSEKPLFVYSNELGLVSAGSQKSKQQWRTKNQTEKDGGLETRENNWRKAQWYSLLMSWIDGESVKGIYELYLDEMKAFIEGELVGEQGELLSTGQNLFEVSQVVMFQFSSFHSLHSHTYK